MKPLILASTSPFRASLLARLGLPFDTAVPDCDETPLPGEKAENLAARLSREKAQSLAAEYPDALIIGSDQVAELDGRTIGKPLNRATAIQQLQDSAGRTVVFHTGVCLLDAVHRRVDHAIDQTRVQFRQLSLSQIKHYVDAEEPYQCAGSFKSEGLGITLFESIHSEDPTALIGLPLIQLTTLLSHAGICSLSENTSPSEN